MECFISFKTLVFLVLLYGLQFWNWWHTAWAVAAENCRISHVSGGTYPGAKPTACFSVLPSGRKTGEMGLCHFSPTHIPPLCLLDVWTQTFIPAYKGVQMRAHCQAGAPELLHDGATWVHRNHPRLHLLPTLINQSPCPDSVPSTFLAADNASAKLLWQGDRADTRVLSTTALA